MACLKEKGFPLASPFQREPRGKTKNGIMFFQEPLMALKNLIPLMQW
jgi:hypothetical protein